MLIVPDKSKINDEDNCSETSGDTEGSAKDRKSSFNNDDIEQAEKGKFLIKHNLKKKFIKKLCSILKKQLYSNLHHALTDQLSHVVYF